MGYFDKRDDPIAEIDEQGVETGNETYIGSPEERPIIGAAFERPGLGGMIDQRTQQRLGNPGGAYAPIQNAVVDPSLATPRIAGNAAQMGAPEDRAISFKVPGPISSAANAVPTAPVTRPPDSFNTQARLDGIIARENQGLQQAQNQNALGNQRAQNSYDAQIAERNAQVARFRATDGADMVLATENRGYDQQRQAIIQNAAIASGKAAAAKGLVGATDAALLGQNQRNYIGEGAVQQEELNRAKVASTQGATGEVALEQQKLTLDQQKQMYALQQELANERDPAKAKLLQNKILALGGKRTEATGKNFAVIDVDTGQFETDLMGNKKPIYKKGVINTDTGEIMGGAAPEASKPDPVAALKALKPDQVLVLAKKALEDGKPLAEINARLKAAGHKEI
jgi:hypothetical protein